VIEGFRIISNEVAPGVAKAHDEKDSRRGYPGIFRNA
jgi:hypothetical protein